MLKFKRSIKKAKGRDLGDFERSIGARWDSVRVSETVDLLGLNTQPSFRFTKNYQKRRWWCLYKLYCVGEVTCKKGGTSVCSYVSVVNLAVRM